MITIQDILDSNIEIYALKIKVWDEKARRYIDEGRWDEDRMKKYRYLPIRYIYVNRPNRSLTPESVVTFEVAIEPLN